MIESNGDMDSSLGDRTPGSKSVDRRLYALLGLATILGVGHHVDHVVRGNHVGWPLIPEVTGFTVSLLIYPLIAVGLYLTLTERVGAGYWAAVITPAVLYVTAAHFGPWALEPPADVIGPYENEVVGYAAFAWLLAQVATMFVTAVYATHRWWLAREAAIPQGRGNDRIDGFDHEHDER
ncbi:MULTISPECIES: hypothetical protein [Natrialba]|uniref:hypothetical protein n=1 Tax=Natrialba TaxID=63742 RepID=UPI001EF03550|nr:MULTISPECIES: hypothetical protein [Natrialba]